MHLLETLLESDLQRSSPGSQDMMPFFRWHGLWWRYNVGLLTQNSRPFAPLPLQSWGSIRPFLLQTHILPHLQLPHFLLSSHSQPCAFVLPVTLGTSCPT